MPFGYSGYACGSAAIAVSRSARAAASCHAAAHACHAIELEDAESLRARDRQWRPGVHVDVRKRERGRHHPNHFRRDAMEVDGTADDGRIAAVATHPQPVRQHGHVRRGAWLAFGVGEPSSQRRRRLQDGHERRRHGGDPDPIGLAAIRERRFTDPEERQMLQRACAIAIVMVEPLGDADARGHVQPARPMVQHDDAVGIRIRQRVQHDALHDGEDRRVGADGQGQRQNGGQRERRIAREPPCRIPDLFAHRLHGDRLS